MGLLAARRSAHAPEVAALAPLGWLLAGTALVVLGACGPAEAPPEPASPEVEAAAPAPPGRIAGRVTLTGECDPAAALDMGADPACVALHQSPVASRVVVIDSGGRLANVLVHIATGLEGRTFDPPNEPRLLDQVGCLFEPRVQGLRAGQPLVVRNSDPTLHNVNAHPTENPAFNFGQPFQGMETKLVFANTEDWIEVRCDTHPWMASYLGVFDHPFFAVTGTDGSFALEEVPPGDYTLRAWHELFGSQDLRVSVASGETAAVEIRFALGDRAPAS